MIDHSGHPHPATPAARALCRANGGTGSIAKSGTKAPATKKVTRSKKTATARQVPSLTESKVAIVDIGSGAPISRDEAGARMFGTRPKSPRAAKAAGVPARVDPSLSEEQKRAIKREHRSVKPVAGKDLTKTDAQEFNATLDNMPAPPGSFSSADEDLTKISQLQGWHAKPGVVTSREMDQLIRDGAEPLYRGVGWHKTTPPYKVLDSLRGEPGAREYQLGSGIYGNGVYFSDSRDTADLFALGDDSGIVRAVISPKAKVITWEEATRLSRAEVDKYRNTRRPDEPPLPPEELKQRRRRMALVSDPGRFAAMLGYDVLQVDNKDDGFQVTKQMVVLNRTVLIMEDSP